MTLETIDVTASTAPAAVPDEVDRSTTDPDARTIRGHLIRWDTPGTASVGPCLFLAGSIELPDDLSRVKLLLDHDKSRPVGYLRSAEVTADGIEGVFHVPPSTQGDLALAQARDGLRDSLSVGTYVTDYEFDGSSRLVVKASSLHEVSLVAIPAFAGALVTHVTASQGETMSDPTTAPDPEATPDATPAAAPTPSTSSTSSSSPVELEAQLVQRIVEATRTAPPVAPGAAAPLTLTAMSELVIDALKANKPAAMVPQLLEAALNDVTPANLSTTDYGPRRPQYVDDLWTAADYDRPTLDAFGVRGGLSRLKMHGWVWEVRPEVATYAGNKADVPSNAPKRKRIEATAQRFAGGWDVDRVFVDLESDTDEVADIFVEATRSYKEQSEDYAATLIREAATELYGDELTVPAALTVIGSYFTQLKGARIGYVVMGSQAWDDFANMSSAEAPWWLRDLGSLSLTDSTGEAAGVRFRVDPELEPTQLLAADRRAARFREVDPPVRVQALDVPRGGIDLGVFGYLAGLVSDPRAIVNVDTAGRVESP